MDIHGKRGEDLDGTLNSGHHRSGSRHGQRPSQITMPPSEAITHSVQVFDMRQVQESLKLLAQDYQEGGSKSKLSASKADAGVKKERIKNLWGKAGKQGAPQQNQTSTAKQSVKPTKWDKVLIPTLINQRQSGLGGETATSLTFFETKVGGEAGSGSGFFGQPGNNTMECDCGDDSCPQCNLMLNMGSGY